MNDRFVEDLKNRIDIVEVVRKYAELKKVGRNFMCRSPFRNERTPSFSVSPDKQFWYDFGISEGGDAISFLEKIENYSFAEAVEALAQMAGVDIPNDFGHQKGPSKEEKQDIFALHQKASDFFATQLQNSKTAQKYLKGRGLTKEIITDWQLGYAGDESDGLTKFLLKEGFSEKSIAESGVAFMREFGDQRMKDRFTGRLMIPITEPKKGQIIAFTGRDLSGAKDIAKYVNSPENPVYHKSSTLFGFDRARKVIGEQGFAILVEGNFDVIAAHMYGFIHTVATCGTSLTDDHLRILKRLTKNVALAFDSDLAGKKATLRAVEMCLKSGLDPFIIDIEGGKDFADLAQESKKTLETAIQKRTPALKFLLDRFALKSLNGSLEGEKQFLDGFFYFLRLSSRPIEVDQYLDEVGKKVNRAKSVIHAEYQKYLSRSSSQHPTRVHKEIRTGKELKPNRQEAFVGFLSAYWSYFAGKFGEDVLEYLSGTAQDVLAKKIRSIDLTPEEIMTLRAWEMHQENLYGQEEPDPTVLQRDFGLFLGQLQKEVGKAKLYRQAQDLREKMGKD